MKKNLSLGFIVLLAILFSGCASSLTTPVNKSLSEITSNKEKSYISFSRPQFVAPGINYTIIEFDPKTKETNLVGTLGTFTRLIYETTPGTHYFYMTGGENDDMIKISTDSSKIYYAETQVQFGVMLYRFYFRPIKKPIIDIVSKLDDSKCDKELLDKYNFEKEESTTINLTKYTSSLLNVKINCSGDKISHINKGFSTIKEINELDIVAPNKKAYEDYTANLKDYLSEIDEDYNEWIKEDSKKTEIKSSDGFGL